MDLRISKDILLLSGRVIFDDGVKTELAFLFAVLFGDRTTSDLSEVILHLKTLLLLFLPLYLLLLIVVKHHLNFVLIEEGD